MKIIGIIPARGGSKGVPRKNIRQLGSKPLIWYSINSAQQSNYISETVVSTEDEEIASIAEKYGSNVINRPEKLAQDHSLVMDTVRHVIHNKRSAGADYELLVLLEPTAPFRTPGDIDKTIELLIHEGADSAATFSETETPPTRTWKFNNHTPEPFIKGSDPFQPRQTHPKGYVLNGMVYVMKSSLLDTYPETNSFLLGRSVGHIIPKDKVVDIDTEFDFFVAEQLLKKKSKTIE